MAATNFGDKLQASRGCPRFLGYFCGWIALVRNLQVFAEIFSGLIKSEDLKIKKRSKTWKLSRQSKILRPLFTLQLLILLRRNPFHTPKCLNQGQKLRIFAILTSICSFTVEGVNLNAKNFNFCY